MTTSPATVITNPSWNNINIISNITIVNGAITKNITANAMVGNQQFLGDANGNPVSVLPSINGPATPGGINFSNAVLNLTEVFTRADGSKLTVAAILDELALAAVPVIPVIPVVPAV